MYRKSNPVRRRCPLYLGLLLWPVLALSIALGSAGIAGLYSWLYPSLEHGATPVSNSASVLGSLP